MAADAYKHTESEGTMTETEKRDHLLKIHKSPCLRWAIYALHRLKVGRAADVARFFNGDTKFHWAGPGAGKFFKVHFERTPQSLYFLRREITKGRSKYVYELTELGKELAKDVEP